jgi:hypothetical protein
MAEPIVTVELELELKKINQQLGELKGKLQSEGKQAGDRFSKSFGGNIFGGLSKQILALGASVVAGLSFKKSIQAAITQQNAINDLNRSLAASGRFTEKASQDFQNFASSLQNTSTFGDEVILQNAALIQSLGNLDQQGLKRATQAAADLSSALGIDLRTASQLVGKAAAGEIGSFSRFGLVIKKGKDNAETFSNTLKALEGRFSGAASARLNTFEGQLERVSNAFGDIFEGGFAGALTKSSVALAVLKTIGDEFTKLAVSASKVNLDDIFTINNIIAFGTALNEFVIAPLELVFNAAKVIFNGINTIVAGSVALIGQKVGFIGDLLNKIGVDNGLTQAFQTFRESSAEVFTGVALDTQESVNNLFNGTVFGKGEAFLENLRVNLEAAKGQIDSSGIRNSLIPQPQATGETNFITALQDEFKVGEQSAADFNASVSSFAKQTKANLMSGVANGAGQAFAAFGKALASGENGLEAFTKSFISSIGQIAVQQGTAFILQGIGYQFIAGKQGLGLGLIKAGAALAAFGGALSAFSGGGLGGGSPTAANGGDTIGGQSITDPRTGLAAPQERIEPNTAVTVNIQGDVFDSEETGLRISNILKESSLNNNVRASVFA